MFHAAAKALKEHIGTMHGAVTVALLEAVRDAKGIMEHFHGDRFTVTFNAANSVSAHAKAACRAALACMAIQKSFADKETFSPAVRFTMGVMSGLATVGNMGGGDVRRHSVVGSVFRDATLLERLCKVYGEGALVGHFVVADASDTYRFQFVDAIHVLSEDHVSRNRLKIAAVRSAIAVIDDDEWMWPHRNAGTALGPAAPQCGWPHRIAAGRTAPRPAVPQRGWPHRNAGTALGPAAPQCGWPLHIAAGRTAPRPAAPHRGRPYRNAAGRTATRAPHYNAGTGPHWGRPTTAIAASLASASRRRPGK